MNEREVKLAYNITYWPELQVYYWGVPKCGNTSVKNALTEASGGCVEQPYVVHATSAVNYVTREQALSDGAATSFAIIRHPYQRVLSLYGDMALRRTDKLKVMVPGVDLRRVQDLDYFIDSCVVSQPDTPTTDVHLRSMSYFLIGPDGKLGPQEAIDLSAAASFIKSKFHVRLRKYNRSSTRRKPSLTHEQKKRVYDRYKVDFINFGYKEQ